MGNAENNFWKGQRREAKRRRREQADLPDDLEVRYSPTKIPPAGRVPEDPFTVNEPTAGPNMQRVAVDGRDQGLMDGGTLQTLMEAIGRLEEQQEDAPPEEFGSILVRRKDDFGRVNLYLAMEDQGTGRRDYYCSEFTRASDPVTRAESIPGVDFTNGIGDPARGPIDVSYPSGDQDTVWEFGVGVDQSVLRAFRPQYWAGGALRIRLTWRVPSPIVLGSGSADVQWVYQVRIVADGEAGDGAFGSEVFLPVETVTLPGDYNLRKVTELTIPVAPDLPPSTEGRSVHLRLRRKGTAAADTLDSVIWLAGVEIVYDQFSLAAA